MTIFISASTPQQPAFIFASYPAGTSAQGAHPASLSLAASAVLQADEAGGWTFDAPGDGRSLTISYPALVTIDCVAICGKGLSGATVAVYGSNDNFATSTLLLAPTGSVQDNAFWARHTAGSFSSFQYLFGGAFTSLTVKHIAGALLSLLPFPDDGVCLAPLQAEGNHLVSYQGLYLGSLTQRVMRPLSLSFGQITPVELVAFDAAMAAGLTNAQGMFFVPDAGEPTVYFGWIDKSYKYAPTQKTGMYQFDAIPFIGRAV